MAIKGFEKQDPYAGLNQLIQLMNQMSQIQERKNKGFSDVYDDFNKQASSYDNTILNDSKERFNTYYEENKSNMDDQTLYKFDSLKEKFDYQEKLNTDYNMFMLQHQDQSQNIIKLTEQYNNANNLDNFTYNTVSFNDKNERVETPISVKMPTREDMGFVDWETWDAGPLDEFNRSANEQLYIKSLDEFKSTIGEHRENYKQSIAQEIEREIRKYSGNKRDFLLKHSDRTGNPIFAYDFEQLQNTEDIYNFALQSATDDGIFDEEEKNAYMQAINTGDSQYIDSFKTRDKQIKGVLINSLSESIDSNFKMGERLSNHRLIFDDIDATDINSEEWATKSKLPSGIELPLGANGEMQSYSYEEVKEVLQEDKMEDPLYQYYLNLDSNLEKVKEDLLQADKNFVNNSGVSLLNKMESKNEIWNSETKNLSAIDGSNVEYSKPGGIQPTFDDGKTDDIDDSKSKLATIDANKQAAQVNIGKEQVKRISNELNELKNKQDNFSFHVSLKGSAGITAKKNLMKAAGKEYKREYEFTIDELKDLKKQYDKETLEVNKAKEQMQIIKDSGLEQWYREGGKFFGKAVFTDAGQAVKELRKIISSYKNKWGEDMSGFISGWGSSTSAITTLNHGLREYETIELQWKEKYNELEKVKKGSKTISSIKK